MKIKGKKGGKPVSSQKNVGKSKKKKDEELSKMSVDDIFSNIAEESSDDEAETVPEVKPKKKKNQKKEKKTKKKEIPDEAGPVVALLGDSWMSRLPSDFLPQYQIWKYCQGGANAFWFSDPDKPKFTNIVREVIELRPDVVIIHMGGNDIKLDCDIHSIVGAITTVYKKLKDNGITTFVTEIPVRIECSRSDLSREEYDKMRMLVNQELCNRLTAVNYNPIIDFPCLDEYHLMKDGVHLSEFGYHVYVAQLVQVIDSYLNKEKQTGIDQQPGKIWNKKGSDSDFDDDMEHASSMSQKEYLAKLKKSDPTFYATLMQSKDVMDLKSSDEDEDDDDEDEDEKEETVQEDESIQQQEQVGIDDIDVSDDDDQEKGGPIFEPPDKLESDSDESDAEEDGLRARGINMVTSSLVAKWEIDLQGDKPLDTFRDVEQGLAAAIESIQGNKDAGTSRYTVEGSQMFNSVVRLCLKHVAPALYKILKLKSAKDNPEKSKRWNKMKNYIKPYLRDMIRLVESVADPVIAEVILSKGILPLLPFYIAHPPVCKVLLKCLITFWSQSHKKVRVLAFIAIYRTTRSLKSELLDWVLKRLYLSYVQNSRFTSPGTWGLIDFMRMCLIELYSLDQAVAYRHAFIYIRQMAFHLRNAIMSQKKERMQLVYNWQYIHCLHLWSELLCKTHPSDALQPLIYPLVQIAVGTVNLQKSAAYFPLVFHICSILTDLSRHTETFIPVLPFLLEVLNKAPLDKKHKKMSLKPFDWLCMLKLSKSQLGESAFKDGIIDQVYDGIVNYLSVESASIGFPELVVPTNLQLKSFLKSSKVPNYTKKVRQLLEKIKENSDLIETKRKGVSFGIADSEAVKNWEISMRQSGTPLQTYYNSWKKVREKEALNRNKKKDKDDDEMEPEEFELPIKRKRELQEKHKAKDRTKNELKGLFDDDDDDDDDSDDEKLFKKKGEKSSNKDDDDMEDDMEDDEDMDNEDDEDDMEDEDDDDDDEDEDEDEESDEEISPPAKKKKSSTKVVAPIVGDAEFDDNEDEDVVREMRLSDLEDEENDDFDGDASDD